VSNPDSFIDEVNEELRRDRLFAAFRRYGWIAVALVLAVVGWAGWNEWSKAQAQARAEAFGDAIVAAMEPTDAAARRTGLAALAAPAGGGVQERAQAAIVNLLLAAESLEGGERAQALAALAAVGADATLPASYRQLATLKRVIAATEAEIPLAERQALLAPLAAPGAPFRPLALEQQALLRLEAGDREGALDGLTGLLREAGVSGVLRARVQQVIVILGGSLEPAQG
jgi:hypothetical protein